MVFAYHSTTGSVTLTDQTGARVAALVTAGGVELSAGTAGTAWTSDTTGGMDPWLFTFGPPGAGTGDGNWEDDKTSSSRDSEIAGNHAKTMWYVAHGWNSGTTTINN